MFCPVFPPQMYNDRSFYMIVLVGYGVAGLRIVDMVRSGRMLVVWATACCNKFAPAQAVTRGEAASLSRGAQQSGTIDI